MEFKDIENQYWNQFYNEQNINYKPNRGLDYHADFKNPMKTLPTGSKILELACGVRCDGIELAQKGFEVYETDISEVAVNKAKKLYAELNLMGVGNFIKCDAENLPFDNKFFDATFIAASFHHLPNPIVALKEMKRVTKDNGYVILGLEPNAWPYFSLFFLLKPFKKIIRQYNKKFFHSIADDTTHGFTKRQLKKIFQSAGLKIVAIKRAKYFSELYDSGLRLFSKIFKRPFLPKRKTQQVLSHIDNFISKIPIVNSFNWHWSIIARVD